MSKHNSKKGQKGADANFEEHFRDSTSDYDTMNKQNKQCSSVSEICWLISYMSVYTSDFVIRLDATII